MIVLESGNNVIQLRSTGFHEITLQQKVSVKRTMDGTFRTNIKTPCNKRYDVDVFMLAVTKKRDFETFLDNVVGQTIKYTDVNGDTYTVQLITDPVDIIQVKANRYTAAFVLEEAF